MNITQIIVLLKKQKALVCKRIALLNTLAFTAEKVEYSLTGDLITKSGEKDAKCVVILEGKHMSKKK